MVASEIPVQSFKLVQNGRRAVSSDEVCIRQAVLLTVFACKV